MATRSPTRRLKSVGLPTFGRPTMATRPRLTELSLGGELLSALLHFEKRVHRGRAAADEADAVLTPQPLRLELVRVLDVVRVATLHLGEVDELARVRRILPAHDDDRVDQLREQDQRAGRVDALETLRLDLRPRLRRDAMRAYDDDAFLRVGGIFDDLDPERAQPLADLGVVDDLAEVENGLPGLGGGFRQLDGLFDPETEPVFAGEEDFHNNKSSGRIRSFRRLGSPPRFRVVGVGGELVES